MPNIVAFQPHFLLDKQQGLLLYLEHEKESPEPGWNRDRG